MIRKFKIRPILALGMCWILIDNGRGIADRCDEAGRGIADRCDEATKACMDNCNDGYWGCAQFVKDHSDQAMNAAYWGCMNYNPVVNGTNYAGASCSYLAEYNLLYLHTNSCNAGLAACKASLPKDEINVGGQVTGQTQGGV